MLVTPRVFWLLLAGTVLTLAGAGDARLLRAGLLLNAVTIAACVIDRLFIAAPSAFQFTRECPDVLSLGAWHRIELGIRHTGRRAVRLRLRDETPLAFTAEPDELHTRVPGRSLQTLRYAVRSVERGAAAFGALTVRAEGPLGLAVRQWTVPMARDVEVYPDITAITRYDLALRHGTLGRFGLRPTRALGEGREFDRLREYVPGDDSRHIDWKATAKRSRPISRAYETERSQRILVVIDAGRLMTARVGEYTKLDYAVNAALLLAHVCMQHGDRVGVLAFSDQVDAYLPPGRGARHLAQLIDVVAHVQPRLLESNYTGAFSYLALRSRRRTLVTIFTDLIDPDASSILLTQMRRLTPRHLPLCVTMRDADVDRALDARVRVAHDVYRQMAAREVRDAYMAVIRKMTHGGALAVNVAADALSLATVNRYVEVKARGLL